MAKTALCIGINNYPGTDMDLNGCVNDANDWSEELGRRGYSVIRLLDARATKAAMVEGMQSVIGNAASGDSVVITFSGHGTYVPDADGDELDGLDEALCPHDLTTGGGALLDDEIRTIFGKRKAGVRLVLISDSCHSGTVTRLAAAEAAEPHLPRPRFLPMGNWMPADRIPAAALAPAATMNAGTGISPLAGAMSKRAGDLLLAGCKEGPNNFSYDAWINGRYNGAFTFYALKTLKTLPSTATYADWMQAVTPSLLPSASYPQSPRIVGSAVARRLRVFA